MGNLNSRETMQLLENDEFKHVCRNLGDFFRSHGEYMQHRRHRSRKETLKQEETKDHGKGEPAELRPKPAKDLNWKCPAGSRCPTYKWMIEQFGSDPLEPRKLRQDKYRDEHDEFREPRHRTVYQPAIHRGADPRDMRAPHLAFPQIDSPNWPPSRRRFNQHPPRPNHPLNNPYIPGVDEPELEPEPGAELDPRDIPVQNFRNFRPAYAKTASPSSSTAASYASPLPRHGPPPSRPVNQPRLQSRAPPLAGEYPARGRWSAAAAGSRSGSNQVSGAERDVVRRDIESPRGGERRDVGMGGAVGGGRRRIHPGRRVRKKYRAGAEPVTAAALGEAGTFWGVPPGVKEEEEEEDEDDAGEPERDGAGL